MATRTGASRKAPKPKAPRVSSNVVELANRKAGKRKKGETPNGTNSGEPIIKDIGGLQVVGKKDEEAFLLYQKKIRTQHAVVEKAKKLVSKERGSLNELYAEAKEAGIPAQRVSALKKLLKEELRPAEDVAAEHKELAWQAHVTKSPLVQLGLFDTKEPTIEGYEMIGEKAGYEGQPADNAPDKPGSEKHTAWMNGWRRGQKKLSEETFNPGQGGDGGEAATKH